ncbi:hypothetical protein [Flavobacterium sp. NKUCC04_CG]|uniref:hypothetical protein n=1 Tax=Flavobacterium sp. NKUCC04_CG TaxID=2842121 RepID=UPI001C5B5AC0|nr:hypothetical protein [Flavobacterium sp. NKUCC04_CG]MBW3519980.1 hypothetical protein [Flavobacterium sp. NKUCC04_CG]
MKKRFLNLLSVAFVLTTIGFLMDADLRESSMLMRFTEFIGMAIIAFSILSALYFSSVFVWNKMRKN